MDRQVRIGVVSHTLMQAGAWQMAVNSSSLSPNPQTSEPQGLGAYVDPWHGLSVWSLLYPAIQAGQRYERP